MAIQVWDDQAQQYRGVELARYGADGTLAEALVWHEGQYRRVWPVGPIVPTPTWEDDFTSPTLHERWTLVDGTYDPPGLSAAVAGPAPASDFEITVTLPGTPRPGFMCGAADMTTGQGLIVGGSGASGYSIGDLMQQSVFWVLDGTDFAWSTVTLRRVADTWTLLVDGQPALGLNGLDPDADPDNPVPVEAHYPIPDLPLLVSGGAIFGAATKVPHVSYTDLS